MVPEKLIPSRISVLIITSIFLLVIATSLMQKSYKWGQSPNWDGYIYHDLVAHYIIDGYSFKNLSAVEFPKWQPSKASYLNRVAYIWLVGTIHRLTDVKVRFIYPLLTLFSYAVSALLIYYTCWLRLKWPLCPAFCAGLWLLLHPATVVMYEVVAHPEPLAILLTTLAFFLYYAKKFKFSLVVLALAITAKESAAFLAVYLFMLELYAYYREQQTRSIFRLMGVVAAAVIGVCVATSLVPNQTELVNADYRAIWEYNSDFTLTRLAFNFDILWVPFIIGFAAASIRIKLAVFAAVLSSMAILPFVTDWWRVLFAPLYFIVIPISAFVIWQLFSQAFNQKYAIIVSLLISLHLYASRVFVAEIGIPGVNWWAVLLMSCAVLLAILVAKKQVTGFSLQKLEIERAL